MKKSFLFLSLMLLSVVLFAQIPVDEGWIEIGNASNNSELYDIDFVSPTTGFAVGTGGAFLKTTDGGNTWSTYDIGVGFSLWQLQFTSASVGYIIGGNNNNGGYFGKILRTTDGGNSWTEIYSQTSELNDIYFLNDSVGWVSAYEKIFLTSDSGSTWTTVTRSGVNSIYNIWFVTASKGYHSGVNSKFYSSDDAGNTWAEQVSGQYLTDLWFSDPVHGYYLNSNRQLLSSVDSGDTWTVLYTFSESVKDVRFLNSSTGFVLNNLGTKVYLTTDAGTTWNIAYQSVNENFNHIELDDNGKLLVVGKGGLIVSTSNGIVWDTLHLGTFSGYLNDITFIDNLTGVAVGDNGKIKRTDDGGISWSTESVHPTKNLKGVSFAESTAIFIAGEDSLILKSTDSCQNWVSSATGFEMGLTKGLQMYSATEGFAYGPEVYKTDDGGSSWAVTGSLGNVFCATVLNNDSAYFGGITSFGYTFDGGNTWTGPLAASNIVNGLYFISADTGVYVNSWGKIFRTTDRGTTWIQMENLGSSFYDITFFDDTTAYAIGHNGVIYKSEDSGINWFQIESHTQRSLRAIWFTPDGTGYIVGQDGMILRKSVVPVYQVDFAVTNDDSNVLANATMQFNGSVYPVGNYTAVGLVAGSYNYVFSCPGHRSDTGVVVVSGDTTINIELEKYHSVTIDVTNYFSNSVGLAGVLFNGDSLVTSVGSGVAFSNVVKGAAYSVQILANHYLPYLTTVDINSDTSFTFVLAADITAPVAQTATGLNDHGFTAVWTAGTNADEYALFVSDDNFVTFLPGYDSLVLTGLSSTITGLAPGLTYYYRLRSVNAYGVSDYSNTGIATTTTGMDEENATIVSVYPNPATDYIVVDFSGQLPVLVSVYDAYGRKLTEQMATVENRIVVADFPCGIYYLHCGEVVSVFVIAR